MVFLFNLLKNYNTFCHSIWHSHQQCTTAPISSHLQHLIFSFFFFILAILSGVRWKVIVVLICTSLMVSNVVHFYVFIDHLHVSGEIPIQVLCLFFNQIDFFGCLVLGVLYILWILSSYQIQDLQIFSPISWISLLLTWLYPIMHRSFILM